MPASRTNRSALADVAGGAAIENVIADLGGLFRDGAQKGVIQAA